MHAGGLELLVQRAEVRWRGREEVERSDANEQQLPLRNLRAHELRSRIALCDAGDTSAVRVRSQHNVLHRPAGGQPGCKVVVDARRSVEEQAAAGKFGDHAVVLVHHAAFQPRALLAVLQADLVRQVVVLLQVFPHSLLHVRWSAIKHFLLERIIHLHAEGFRHFQRLRLKRMRYPPQLPRDDLLVLVDLGFGLTQISQIEMLLPRGVDLRSHPLAHEQRQAP
mmetsp:Transcript_53862/g.125870  ORF Transcript_53862/g.125870 Transcript_53862/m.125870 type:complete len:223 (+) Transcript_53862:745-1413(+)